MKYINYFRQLRTDVTLYIPLGPGRPILPGSPLKPALPGSPLYRSRKGLVAASPGSPIMVRKGQQCNIAQFVEPIYHRRDNKCWSGDRVDQPCSKRITRHHQLIKAIVATN